MISGRKLTWLVAAVGLAAALWLLLVPRPVQGPGGLPKGGDFTLKSADGPVVLADLRGKVVLIYFGYLNCPDVCPTSVAAA
ncbi:MAG: SCO family protein, partial [Gallionellaceae bacterium]|nr:SCO family protein [Gallionellaceae bacterium]